MNNKYIIIIINICIQPYNKERIRQGYLTQVLIWIQKLMIQKSFLYLYLHDCISDYNDCYTYIKLDIFLQFI